MQEPVQIHAVPGGMSMLIRILTNIIMKAINNPLNSEFLKERALVFDIGYIIKQLKVLLENA